MYIKINILTDKQATQLYDLYQHKWWTKGRTLDDVHKMLINSDYIFGICESHSQKLVAFAHVVSDRTYRAIIYDVIVAANHRHQGLGSLLIEQIVSHPEISQIECVQLCCLPETIPFYQKFGFDKPKTYLLARQRVEKS
ncbi:MAG: GNAT family N-acetyltransferase [Pseudanabaena frigida]|uniref:GNAT family N-acetyltransferase n=1 Tax=Pseudanabaena frigida TaxID=945775 RepID=A0A2W4YCD5_9CYAN|nr:MAG: GNAT family N-acetyltransferase [Pseudanabaena frigida]